MDNRIDIELLSEDFNTVMQAFATIPQKMPFLTKLSKAELSDLQAMDDGQKPFVEKALEYGTNVPEINPGNEMLACGKRDNHLHTQLTQIMRETTILSEMVSDTRHLAGAEVFVLARFIYSDAKLQLKKKIPGMQSIVDDLGKLFNKQGNSVADKPAV